MTPRRISAPVLVLAGVLALASAAAGVRALAIGSRPPSPPDGAFGSERGPSARTLVQRMASGLLELQEADGGFRAEWEGGFQSGLQRVASSSIAIAALATLRKFGLGAGVPGLGGAVDRGLDFLVANQRETGPVGELPLGGGELWYQVDATSAALLGWIQSDRPTDATAAERAGPALVRFARDGLRLGWTRALAAMTIARTFALDRSAIFPAQAGRLLRWREPGPRRDTSDWRVSEAIVRLMLVDRFGVDPYPAEIQAACAAEPPRWHGQSSDMQSWWMQAWLMARSADPEPWFADMLAALDEEAVNAEGRIPGGHYADGIIQTGCGILAVIEGLVAQVVVR